MVRPDTAAIMLAKGQELVQPPSDSKEPRQRPAIEIGWLKPGETKRVSWTVKGAGNARVTIGSTRGGVDAQEVVVK